MRFGISTHLFHDQRLSREHLALIAAHGFEAVEVFATRSHFDYHDPSAIKELSGWLNETGLALHGVHAPIVESMHGGDKWGATISNAVGDTAQRQAAVREVDLALNIAREITTDVLVVHLGTPTVQGGENNRTAAFRSVEDICRLAEPVAIKVALETIPNPLSDAASLVTMLERDLDFPQTGICLDFGHAFLMGDVVDAIEAVAEHLVTTHVHDNNGKKDEHLAPFDGRINWDIALMTMQKVGYDGTYLMELANLSTPAEVLQKAQAARKKFEKLMAY
ncbi:MAG TPA: sugar phosphate isomerase/epimerase family protein [Vicinamibacterales bacterium]|nr:sugar phosphate isomerase/epimerase family protein [Vicinamibacterales bacterium]